MTPDEWFDRLETVLADAGARPTGDERDLLLDLARIAAHASERWAAPLSTYLAGRALADRDAEERIAVLRTLVAALDDAGGGDG
jgi:hypothetical protein